MMLLWLRCVGLKGSLLLMWFKSKKKKDNYFDVEDINC